MATASQELAAELADAPESVQREVLHFLGFLKARRAEPAPELASLLPAAESAWADD